jgi:hypothetical protein
MSTTAIGNGLIAILALLSFESYVKHFVLAGLILLVLIVFTVIASNYEYAKPADDVIN